MYIKLSLKLGKYRHNVEIIPIKLKHSLRNLTELAEHVRAID